MIQYVVSFESTFPTVRFSDRGAADDFVRRLGRPDAEVTVEMTPEDFLAVEARVQDAREQQGKLFDALKAVEAERDALRAELAALRTAVQELPGSLVRFTYSGVRSRSFGSLVYIEDVEDACRQLDKSC